MKLLGKESRKTSLLWGRIPAEFSGKFPSFHLCSTHPSLTASNIAPYCGIMKVTFYPYSSLDFTITLILLSHFSTEGSETVNGLSKVMRQVSGDLGESRSLESTSRTNFHHASSLPFIWGVTSNSKVNWMWEPLHATQSG